MALLLFFACVVVVAFAVTVVAEGEIKRFFFPKLYPASEGDRALPRPRSLTRRRSERSLQLPFKVTGRNEHRRPRARGNRNESPRKKKEEEQESKSKFSAVFFVFFLVFFRPLIDPSRLCFEP